jgi:Photosynthesis system II assembly factor YCF48/Putative zinc-finger
MNNDSARDKAMDKLVEAKLRSGLNPGSPSCLDAEILAAFVERTLTSRERANCESHLASCAHCQEQVAMLARLAEADEAAPVGGKAKEPARAAGFNWFRWAWAGPALAALLVIGIYVGGPFKREIQQMPRPESRIEKSVPAQTATGPSSTKYKKNEIAAPAATESGSAQLRAPAAKKSLDLTARADTSAGKPAHAQNEPASAGSLGGVSTHEESAPKTKSEELKRQATTPAVVRPTAPASNTVAPAVAGAIATPSERAALAKDDRGQGAGVGASISGGVGGEATPPAGANSPPASQQMGDFSARRRTAQSSGPQSVPPPAPEKTAGSKPAMQDEVVAKEEAQTTDAERDKLSEDVRQPKQTAAEVSITSASQGLMNKRASAAPVWRVGPRGLIQKLESDGKWKKQKSGVKVDLYSSAFAGADVGWAVGQAGTILRTTNGGANWTQVAGPTTEDLVQVSATSAQAASVSTRSGSTFKTIDGGHTWTTGQ